MAEKLEYFNIFEASGSEADFAQVVMEISQIQVSSSVLNALCLLQGSLH
jgi:hypothetical protein